MMISKTLRFFPTPAFISGLLIKPSIKKSLDAIYEHPFNKTLFDGSLDPDIFSYYLHNDDYYLKNYAQSLLTLSARTIPVNPKLSQQLNYLATGIVSDEKAMQREYQEYLDLLPATKPGPAIETYVNFLKANESAELCVSLCSILPCFWIYYKLGKKHPCVSTDNRYYRWVKTYSSSEFANATNELVNEVNKIAAQADQESKHKMEKTFQQAVEHELNFFEESYDSKVEPKLRVNNL